MKFVKVSHDNEKFAIELQAELFPNEKSPAQVREGIHSGNPVNYIVYKGDICVGIVGYYFMKHLPEYVLIN